MNIIYMGGMGCQRGSGQQVESSPCPFIVKIWCFMIDFIIMINIVIIMISIIIIAILIIGMQEEA